VGRLSLRRYAAATEHTSNVAAVTTIDRMTCTWGARTDSDDIRVLQWKKFTTPTDFTACEMTCEVARLLFDADRIASVIWFTARESHRTAERID